MVAGVANFFSNLRSCVKSVIQALRRTNLLRSLPATDPFVDVRLDLLRSSSETVIGTEYLFVILDRFSK